MPGAAIASSSAPSPASGDQVDELQRLQKAAQKITSILDLDELIDKIVNDVAHSFGCVEANIYLHDADTGGNGAGRRARLHRQQQGPSPENRQGGHGGLRRFYRARCATLPTCARTSTTSRASTATLSEVAIPLHVGEHLVGVFTASHPGAGCISAPAIENPSRVVRSHRRGRAQCAAFPIRTQRAPGHEPGGPGGPRDSAGAAAQEFAVHARLCNFRT